MIGIEIDVHGYMDEEDGVNTHVNRENKKERRK